MAIDGDFIFKEQNGSTFSKGVTVKRERGLYEKYGVEIPKIFETNNEKCPVKKIIFFVRKRSVNLQNSGPFYWSITTTSLTWFK